MKSMSIKLGRPSSSCLAMAVLATAFASQAVAQPVSVESWLRHLASTQKFELVVGVGVGRVMVTPPDVATPAAIGEVLAKAGVPFGFTTSKDGKKILILQLGIDALSKSVGIPGGAVEGERDSRLGRKNGDEPEPEAPAAVEDPNDPRLQSRPALPAQADPDDPAEAFIDRSIPPLPKQIDLNDPEEAQIDPARKPLPPQIDYNDPDERRTPPPVASPNSVPGPVKPSLPAPPKKTGPVKG